MSVLSGDTMRAAVHEEYGSPDLVELRDVEKPVVLDNQVLVRVRAASVNPLDWHQLTGTPYLVRTGSGLRKPKQKRLGVDFAGMVEAVGKNVTLFRPGDEVFGGASGAFAEYVCIQEDAAVAPKPAGLSFERAATVPVAAITALQGLRDRGGVQPGHSVLINGASGGVGTFAVQIAKAFGAHVTGVCSTRNVETVRSLGADHVIDYTREDFTLNGQRYDVLLDIAGSRSWSEYRRVLKPKASLVLVGGPKTNRLIGPLGHVARVRLAGLPGSRKVSFFLAKLNKADMAVLGELLESGKVTPHIDRRYALSEIADALRYLGAGHAHGKIAITVQA
jgi:NADPH:quinone reductase-like Zn-dependent oxidoreductase